MNAQLNEPSWDGTLVELPSRLRNKTGRRSSFPSINSFLVPQNKPPTFTITHELNVAYF
jgi:hypothetical protein